MEEARTTILIKYGPCMICGRYGYNTGRLQSLLKELTKIKCEFELKEINTKSLVQICLSDEESTLVYEVKNIFEFNIDPNGFCEHTDNIIEIISNHLEEEKKNMISNSTD
mmetsp:Transcript_22562/g.25383  ORF Transcript_22562/g.25383 Transcript_22562/m.25383 type:complete len:110 (+) Transcript_22562:61-390(+)